jgi:hypothetical protein
VGTARVGRVSVIDIVLANHVLKTILRGQHLLEVSKSYGLLVHATHIIELISESQRLRSLDFPNMLVLVHKFHLLLKLNLIQLLRYQISLGTRLTGTNQLFELVWAEVIIN